MNIFPEVLSNLMEKNDIDDNELGRLVNVNRTTVTRWRKGIRSPKMEKLPEIASVFNVDPRIFIGKEQVVNDILSIYDKLESPRQQYVYGIAEQQLEEQNSVPYLGGVAANPKEVDYGDPIYEEKINTTVPAKAEYALSIHGDSMNPEYSDGDIIFYREQPSVENSELAIVEIEGKGVTCKKFYYDNIENKVILRSYNKKYGDRVLNPEQVRVIGKVVK